MIVGRHMAHKKDLRTVCLDDKVRDVLDILRDKNYLSLPVVGEDKFLGVVYKSDIYSELISTDLSKEDFLNQEISKYTIKELESVETQDLLEVASSKLIDAKQSFLPVYEAGEFVGIITPTAIFKANSNLLGIGKGTRVSVRFSDIPGRIAQVADIVNQLGGNIITMVVDNIGLMNISRIIMRVENCDVQLLKEKLNDSGFSVERID